MNRVLALLAATALSTGWNVAAPAPAAASCAEVVVWHDTAYFRYAGSEPHPPPGVGLPGAVAPGCNDTGGDPPSPTQVDARAIAGVPPAVALIFGHSILVAPGYFPQVPGFPIRWGPPVADETETCRISGALTLAGRAHPTPGRLDIRTSGRLIDLIVDVHTRFTGLARNGLPYIGDGQAVRIEAVRCGGKTVARRISAAGRIVPPTSAEDILGADWRGGPSIVTSAGRHRWWAAGGAAVTAALAGSVLIVRRRPRAARRG